MSGFKGIYAGVFDGNTGWQLASACEKKLHGYLSEELKKGCKTDKEIERAVMAAFDRVEEEWQTIASAGFKVGFPQAAYVSSTALITLVRGNKLYVANAGDSSVCLIRVKADKSIEAIKLNKIHDANNVEE